METVVAEAHQVEGDAPPQPGPRRFVFGLRPEFDYRRVEGEVPLPEEIGESLHPRAYVGGRKRRLRLIGKEAAHQPREPCVVVGVADQRDQLPQRRRTPQEFFRKTAQRRRGSSLHRIASSRRPVAAA